MTAHDEIPEWERELLERQQALAAEHLGECAECGTTIHICSSSRDLVWALEGLWRQIHRQQSGCRPQGTWWRSLWPWKRGER